MMDYCVNAINLRMMSFIIQPTLHRQRVDELVFGRLPFELRVLSNDATVIAAMRGLHRTTTSSDPRSHPDDLKEATDGAAVHNLTSLSCFTNTERDESFDEARRRARSQEPGKTGW